MASVQNSQHLKKTKWPPRKFEHFTASGHSETHFPTFSMIWATFCTRLNHCFFYVLFISQPQNTNFEQNLTRSLHFIGEVGGAYWSTWVWAIAATHWQKRTQNWDLFRQWKRSQIWKFSRELVSIYEVKIPASILRVNPRGLTHADLVYEISGRFLWFN